MLARLRCCALIPTTAPIPVELGMRSHELRWVRRSAPARAGPRTPRHRRLPEQRRPTVVVDRVQGRWPPEPGPRACRQRLPAAFRPTLRARTPLPREAREFGITEGSDGADWR